MVLIIFAHRLVEGELQAESGGALAEAACGSLAASPSIGVRVANAKIDARQKFDFCSKRAADAKGDQAPFQLARSARSPAASLSVWLALAGATWSLPRAPQTGHTDATQTHNKGNK